MATARDYPEDTVHKALELAAAIGIRAAGRSLEIPEKTIRNWASNPAYSERWAELRRVNAPKWRARAAVPLEDLVDEYAVTLAEALRIAHDQITELDPKDLGNFIRSIAVAHGVASDHVGKLRGQPTQIVEHTVNAERLEAAMTALLEEAKTIEGSAVEVEPPELEA